jgi:hypothetical protein
MTIKDHMLNSITSSLTESEKMSIRAFRKEYKLSLELNNCIFEGRCTRQDCTTDYKRLAAIQFHHLDPKIKLNMWSELMHKSYNLIKIQLESELVELVCNNCHSMENALIYNDFEYIIMDECLFEYDAEEIDKMIDKAIKYYSENNKKSIKPSYLKFEINRWIKKRSVIQQVFDGKCIVCDENRLPALQMHHLDSNLKNNRLRTMLDLL